MSGNYASGPFYCFFCPLTMVRTTESRLTSISPCSGMGSRELTLICVLYSGLAGTSLVWTIVVAWLLFTSIIGFPVNSYSSQLVLIFGQFILIDLVNSTSFGQFVLTVWSIRTHFGQFVLILINSYSCFWSVRSHFGTFIWGHMHQLDMTDLTHPCVSSFGRTFRIREAILDKIIKLNPFKYNGGVSVRPSIQSIHD